MENISDLATNNHDPGAPPASDQESLLLPRCCAIRFRPTDQPRTALSQLTDLGSDELVMVQTEHGLEPALIHHHRHPCGPAVDHQPEASAPQSAGQNGAATTPLPLVLRRASAEEAEKFHSLQKREAEAFATARKLIGKHRLPMKLIRAERYFNGGKIIFYFTAENRVDFRELVKDLVQEFRTRVEIRQVGVRHETKMIGGIGCCGRELCCSSYIRNFAPVSIKMAKEQGLPLNPGKISGICNRLLCCLTYEFETYRELRKSMPRPGKQVMLDGKTFKVFKVNVLEQSVEVRDADEPERLIVWQASEWQRCAPATGGGQGGQGGQRKGKKT